MKVDIIEYYMVCENTPVNDCLGETLCTCKYDWFCTSRMLTDWTQMFYSEGE